MVAASCTCASRTVPSFPRDVRVMALNGTATATPRTWGSRPSWRTNPGEYAGVVNGCTTRPEGFVPARNSGYDE